MAKRGIPLDRILRVRTLQLGLVRATEARAHEKLTSEAALKERIAQLAANVAAVETVDQAVSFLAAAHYRERLTTSALAAEGRLQTAQAELARATAATIEARRDQNAIEKLMARDDAVQALKEVRALEKAPPVRRVRHDPC
ncbi:MAG: hypothetical protein WC803_00675 [Sphingomonas sp.]|jgi:hypothetical protein